MPLSAAVSNCPLFFFPHSPLPPPRHPSLASLHGFSEAISSPCTPRAPSLLRQAYHLSSDASETAEGIPYPSSAAVAAVIRRSSPASPVEFTQRTERLGKNDTVLPSPDFQRLCVEQLDLFRAVVDPHAVLSIYVRPAGSYVMDQLELRRVIYYPGVEISKNEECVVIVGNFAMPGGLHAAEIVISRQEVEVAGEFGAIIFPLVKHPFLVGFLVAELPKMMVANCATCAWEPLGFKEEFNKSYGLPTSEKRLRAIMISRSLATAYVMDQKSMLLRQTSWQNNVRMGHLVEQIHGFLSSIKALSKMLSLHVKRSEIAYDIVDDILVQGDSMKDAIQQLQDAVQLTKANIVQFSQDSVKKMQDSFTEFPDLTRSLLADSLSRDAPSHTAQSMKSLFLPNSDRKDVEVPMPPLILVPQQEHTIRQIMQRSGGADGFGQGCIRTC
ncbi:hypothetical protein KSP39_PZI017142 [Platanthera zijinensis]|uniref:Uncharacterized protein n=1 Tax=Platanthera zijinensis TaxID=2320716 RepID=A0AAP0B637_9ASPA